MKDNLARLVILDVLPICPKLRDLSIHKVLCVMLNFVQPVMYRPKIGIVQTRKLGVRSKTFLFSDICLIMHAPWAGGGLSLDVLIISMVLCLANRVKNHA